MLGAVIGDIVGSVYEWNNIKTKNFTFFKEECKFTDDTVMTFAVANALLKTFVTGDEELFKEILIEEMQRLGKRFPHAGYGGMFRQWLIQENPKPYNSYGNGSAMRVSPIGFIARSLEEAEQYAKVSAEVTHNHPEGIKGAVATAGAIYLARQKVSKEQIRKYAQQYYNLNFTLDEIRPKYTFNETCQDTVPQAFVAFLEAEDFDDAIRNGISIGGDSDTLAAITGGIAEAYYGIPEDIQKKAKSYLKRTEFPEIYEKFYMEYSAA